MSWISLGLRGGILTTRYPKGADAMPVSYRGKVEVENASTLEYDAAASVCLSHAIRVDAGTALVSGLRCFQCGECARVAPTAFRMSNDFELAQVAGSLEGTRAKLRSRARALGRSVHVRHVDAGSDGSEEQELAAIFNPFYDANRLGIFLTASPRHADILIVTGVVTKAMETPLKRTYEAMPEPKSVIALGTTACSGGIFTESTDLVGPVNAVVPVDVFVPGTPPAPLSILHGLSVALGQVVARSAAS